MNCKLLALDMDGTLLNSQSEVSEENRRAIHLAQQAGVQVVLATGRSLREIKQLTAGMDFPGPVIANNGSEIWVKPGILHGRYLMKEIQVRHILDVINSCPDPLIFWAHSTEASLMSIDELIRWPKHHIWLQLGFKTSELSWLSQVRKQLTDWGEVEVSSSSPDNVEVNPKGRSKGAGLIEVCDLLGISPQDTIAVGDGNNDLSASVLPV
ncbi:HAD family hydrolase [Paenibacillus senegalensis]|uniref:HAD family hydrolase n=1 Tax=Paenibacillus senegalensis TaxID=1465766 RepID=UPI000289F279|nr:HAD family hydrolase [Paenibacillus senegalensis]